MQTGSLSFQIIHCCIESLLLTDSNVGVNHLSSLVSWRRKKNLSNKSLVKIDRVNTVQAPIDPIILIVIAR